ncbi:MAG: molecular chaperone HscC [Eubacterium sp.]|nr:molecular chaperone HscC [Eubacterium sp.]
MAIIGIDLGTTNSLASVWKNGRCELIPNSFGEFLTPSVVGFDDDGSIIIGKIAKQRLISHPDLTAASFKCFMGTNKEIMLGNKSFTPPELSSFILRQLKEDAELYLGEPVEEAVISVPAYFDDNGRSATKLAGELAGLKVERIINEPSAAALAYKQNTDNEDMFLIFDFGGGTLDISIVDIFESVIEIVAVAGDNHLGGDNFNQTIAEYFCKANNLNYGTLPDEIKAIIIKQAELCKIALSTQRDAAMVLNFNNEVYTLALDNQKLLDITASIFEKIEVPIVKAMQDARVMSGDLPDIILIGGSSHMLLVQKYLENLFHREISVTISPDTAVAIGVGIAAGIKERNEEVKDMVLTDICPFSLGIDIINRDNLDAPYFSPIIERNTTLPASIVKPFYTACDNQRAMEIRIAQGEKMYFKHNLYLGKVEMKVTPAPKGERGVDVRFTYDIN